MKVETLKEFSLKHGWELSYSKHTQDWKIRRVVDGVTFILDPTFDDVSSVIQYDEVTISSFKKRPRIVCLCGSTRFVDTFNEWRKKLTLDGKIELVLPQSEREDPQHNNYKVKQALDELHLRKIDLADEVMIINVGGYVGESTQKELTYAICKRKKIRFLEGLPAYKTIPASI